jgi:ketosteroid isomerase-like protein
MHQNAQLIEHFYSSFSRKDYAAMQSCYHPEAQFTDPVFQQLSTKQVKAMWQMLIERGADLQLVYSGVEANDTNGSCTWVATYTFSQTGRKVENHIRAAFEFKDGKIYRHTDRFDFWKWTRMALGTPGLLLGWTGFLQDKVRAKAMAGLTKFIEKHPEYQEG